ncbi:MAG: AbrB/MazE/SpoVT family DNA-binding domain-containing protein [Tepidiformaceae bacterium]
MTTVTVDNAGRMVLPEDVREAMGLDEGGELEIEVSKELSGTTVVLRHHIPDDDAWAYTEENLEAIRRAEEDYRAGRVFTMSEADLRKAAGVGDEE